MSIYVIEALSIFGLGIIIGISGVIYSTKNKKDTSYTNIEKIYTLHKKYDINVLSQAPLIIDNPVYLKEYHDTMIKFYDYMIIEENGFNIFDM
jgi:hypothetical protein